jgi:hypothetical protein
MEKGRNLFVLLSGLFAALAFLGRPFTVINLMVVPADCACICGQKEKRMSPSLWSKREKNAFICLFSASDLVLIL